MNRARLSPGLVMLAFLLAGCSVSPAAPPAATPGGSGPPAATAGTTSPAASAATPAAASPPSFDAPAATMVVGGRRVAGEVGGYTWRAYSQSAPWLPAGALETVTVAAGERLAIELAGGAIVESWTASAATAADASGDVLTGLGAGGATIRFAAPAAGDWVVAVTIVYGGGLGSGAYYWHLVTR